MFCSGTVIMHATNPYQTIGPNIDISNLTVMNTKTTSTAKYFQKSNYLAASPIGRAYFPIPAISSRYLTHKHDK